MTELRGLGLKCCGQQRRHDRKVWTIMGSQSASGLSMSCICGYCGASHQVSIPYPHYIRHLPVKEQIKSLTHHMIHSQIEGQFFYSVRKAKRNHNIGQQSAFSAEEDELHYARGADTRKFFKQLEVDLMDRNLGLATKKQQSLYWDRKHRRIEALDERWEKFITAHNLSEVLYWQ
jgi:hypothetical protein